VEADLCQEAIWVHLLQGVKVEKYHLNLGLRQKLAVLQLQARQQVNL
jgi:hypothetical protein